MRERKPGQRNAAGPGTESEASPRFVLRRLAGILALLFSVPVLASAVGNAAPTEEQVKAAFLLNFPKYVEWPGASFPSPDSPYVFVVLGDVRIQSALREMMVEKQVGGRPFVIADEDQLDGGAHVVFVAAGAEGKLASTLAQLPGQSVLTVGESERFLRDGGVVNLARRDRKIRLQINLGAANDKVLKISSKLLSVSEVVDGEGRVAGR